MIDWIKSLFGKGTLVFEITTDKGDTGRAKVEYVGKLNTLTDQDKCDLIKKLELEQDIKIVSWEYLGAI